VLLQVLSHVPLGEKIHLATQQRLVVGGQLAGTRRELPEDQRIGGVGEERRRVLRAERLQVGRGAEVAEQQKARCQVLRDGRGGVRAGGAGSSRPRKRSPARGLPRAAGRRSRAPRQRAEHRRVSLKILTKKF